MRDRIYRSRTDSVISGVCGGIAEYFEMDSSIVRIALVILTMATGGLGIVAYLICALVIPLRPVGENVNNEFVQPSGEFVQPSGEFIQPEKGAEGHHTENGNKVVGGILVFLGVFFMAKKLFWWIDFWMIAPIICIIVGIMLINKGRGV